jgi:integrase
MASVKRRANGSWRARYRDLNGREHAQHFSTHRDADSWLDSVRGDMSRGIHVDPRAGKITYEKWSAQYFAGALHKRPTTLARDKIVNETHFVPAIGKRALSSLTPLDIRQIVEGLADHLAPATVRTDYGVLRAVLSAAVDADLLAVSPCRGVNLPANTRKEIWFLSADELERLAHEIPEVYRPMVYLAGVLGLRWSEVAGLRVSRIDFARKRLEISETCAEVDGKIVFADVKTRPSRRTLNVPTFVVDMLSEHLARRGTPKPDALVFVAPEGGALRRSTFRARVFDPAVTRAGLDGLTFHGLRHTAAGLLIEAGAHIETIKQRLGHSSIRVTSDVYGSLLPAVDEGVTTALEQRFAKFSRTHRGLEPGAGSGPELS